MNSRGHLPPRSARFFRYRVVLIAALLLLGGCAKKESSSQRQSESQSTSSPSAPQTQRPANGKLTAAEMKYGVAPPRKGDYFVYRDDVVIVDHGADAVRSLSSNGMIWTIDATAPHADEVQAGKIMFLTDRAVGRVLKAERKGNDLEVILGPFELTDVYKELQITVDQPLDLNSMVAYPAPYPGAEDALITSQGEPLGNGLIARSGGGRFPIGPESLRTAFQPIALRESAWEGSSNFATDQLHPPFSSFSVFPTLEPAYLSAHAEQQAHEPPNGKITIKKGDFELKPYKDGLGMHIEYSKGGLQVKAGVGVYFENPYVYGKIAVYPTKKIEAVLDIGGAAGLFTGFEASTTAGLDVNVDESIPIQVDMRFNLFGKIQEPFGYTLRQWLIFKTAFSAKNSVLIAGCNYTFGGKIHMAFHNGTFEVSAPKFDPGTCLMNSVAGMSLGAGALVLGLQGKLIFGIGAGGFVAGPSLGYDTSIGVTRGSDQSTAMVGFTCKSSDLAVAVDAGVGYAIPPPLVDAINFFLRAVGLKEIDGVGSVKPLKTVIVPHRHDSIGGSC